VRTNVLFLASQTADTTSAATDEEFRAIGEVIDPRRLCLVPGLAVRVGDLLPWLNAHRPAIVHFAGHGDGLGGIIVRDDRGASIVLDSQKLNLLFANFRDVVRVVVLSACYTHALAEAIAAQVECAIGTSRVLGNDAAKTFSSAFYDALSAGLDVDAAYRQAVTSLHLADDEAREATGLFTRADANPGERVFPKDPPSDALREFLGMRFTNHEFREFAQRLAGEHVDWNQAPAHVAGDFEALRDARLINPAFFDALDREFPARRPTIDEFREEWRGVG